MKILRYAITAAGWVAAVLLAAIYGAFVFVYIILIVGYRTPQVNDMDIHALFPIGIMSFALAIGFGLLIAFACKRGKWDPKGYWRAVILVLLALPLFALVHDAPPVGNDYTREDIAPPSKKAEESYDVFMTYRRGEDPFSNFTFNVNAPHIGSLEAITNALPYADEIEKAWQDIAAGRTYIEKLDSFEQIVDLTPSIALDFKIPIVDFMALRTIAQVHWAYAALKAEEGRTEEGVRHLVQLHSVCRKALPNCSIFLSKMIWTAIAGGDIETAYHIAAKTNCSLETLEILKAGFGPLTKEDVSLRRPLIAEYLHLKNMCENLLSGTNCFDCFTWVKAGEKKPRQSFLKKTVSRLAFPFCFNRNRTVRDLKRQFDLLIAGASQCPPDVSGEMNTLDMKRPRLRNPIGQLLFYGAVPSFSRCIATASKINVLSDLLAITLHKRLGEELDLPDFYTGKEYIVDKQTGAVMSAGPDGKAGTEDDIKLGNYPK